MARASVWNTFQLYTSGTLSGTSVGLRGDDNQNGVVDAAGYRLWRKTDGTQGGYDVWRTHFGQTAGSGSGPSANAAVPEPATLAMFFMGMLAAYARRRTVVS